MKLSIAASVCLASILVSYQVTAKPSKSIPGCLREAKVLPPDEQELKEGCITFAQIHGTTFENLLLWNKGLHENCDNLDVDNDICVEGPVAEAASATKDHKSKPKTQSTGSSPKSARPLYPKVQQPEAAAAAAKSESATTVAADPKPETAKAEPKSKSHHESTASNILPFAHLF
ncbi:hypothetical protein BGW38_006476 [Lunasporangiospora selenospora]|uniref:LysM domain-containing protein n=1 Tax=Lunasporangiospora selenospora TaxID=979761 RepID=A0A9P6FZG4_9FUNG|nr:hypothetical protein BGW38_006476 [Lunasporangiospora selenospora]